MMIRLLMFALLGFGLYFWWRWKHTADPEQRRKLILNALFWGVIALVVALAATGRIHWLGAAFAGLLVMLKQLGLLVLRLFPALAHIYGRRQRQSAAGSGAAVSTSLSVSEARKILDVGLDASPEEIKQAHRRQMSKQHPDHGGNAYFAAKLNEARDILMAQHKEKRNS